MIKTGIKKIGSRCMAATLLSLLTLTASAVPAAPTFFGWEQRDGSRLWVRAVGDEYFHFYEDAAGQRFLPDENGNLQRCQESQLDKLRRDGASRRTRMGGGVKRINTSYPTKGKSRACVILVSFNDNDFTIPEPAETFRRMLNEEGFSDYSATGSARDYFMDSSCGQFDIEFDVYGPVKLPGSMAYYGAESYKGHDSFPEEITINACLQLDDEIDFTQYDRDGDGEIDNVYIFYAGRGQASGGGAETIWPHSADVFSGFNKTHKFDGLLLNHYAMSNELDASLSLSGIGTFCHEFSHVLGLPDFYATTYTTSFTCGTWSVMDYGPYLNEGHTPPVYGAYERYALGWLSPEILGDAPQSVRLAPITSENRAMMLRTEKDTEYFIFENRQQEGWDKYIPGHGMLVWHIDYYPTIWQNNSVNNNPNHLYVDIVEADGVRDEKTRDGDSFPGAAGITELSDFTSPSLRSWGGVNSGKDLVRIREIDGEIFFEYCGGNPPLPMVEGWQCLELSPTGATIAWNPVEDAETYLVSLYQKFDDAFVPVAEYTEVNTDGKTIFEFRNLDFSSDYRVKVMAENKWWRSLEGEGFLFSTADPTFDYLTAPSPDYMDITEDGLNVKWEPMENAVSYELMLFDRQVEKGEEDRVDFEGQMIPEGWSTTGSDFYKSTAYSGEAVPSLKLNPEEHIASPVYKEDIAQISVWHRSSLNSEDQALRLVVRNQRGVEVCEAEIPVSRVTGGYITNIGSATSGISSFDHGRSVEFSFKSGSGSALAIDDIVIFLAGKTTDTELETAEVTADKCSYTFTDLNAGQLYYIQLRGINAEGLKSQWSAPISFRGPEELSVNIPETDDQPVQLYDLFGRKVNTPARNGIYLTNTKQKIIIK